VHELSAKYGTPYFVNMLPDYRGNMANYMGCRTSLGDNWTGDWSQDCLRTGNLAYITLNLPRMAYSSRDDAEVFDYLDNYLHQAEEVLLLRRKHALSCLDDYSLLPFLTQEFDGDRYYSIDNATLSFGFVGLNEMLQYHCGEGIENPDSRKFGLKIIKYMNQRAKELKEETGLRWTVLQTPAESTAYPVRHARPGEIQGQNHSPGRCRSFLLHQFIPRPGKLRCITTREDKDRRKIPPINPGRTYIPRLHGRSLQRTRLPDELNPENSP